MDVRAMGTGHLSVKRVELDHVQPVRDKEHGSTQNNSNDHVKAVGDGHAKSQHHASQNEEQDRGQHQSEFEWLDAGNTSDADDHSKEHFLDVKV